MSSRIDEINNQLRQIRDIHYGAVLARGQDHRMRDLMEKNKKEFDMLGSIGRQAFDEECTETNPSGNENLKRLMEDLITEKTELEEKKIHQR